MEEHIPVLLNEVIEGLDIKPDGVYLDLTLGRAGHSSKILEKLTSGRLIGVDQDIEAINKSSERLSKISDRFTLVHSNFSKIDEILDSLGIEKVDGILMDLGVSSPQFDNPERGFSYREDAPLDMRMDQSKDKSALTVISSYSLNDLTRVLRDYGEEKYAFQIAKNIIKRREKEPITTTFQLVDVVKASKPWKELEKAGHPAKQVFQAIRIEVNDELNVEIETLTKALNRLKSGGRLAVITFHSLEDRIAKNIFKEATTVIGNRLDGPNDREEKDYYLVNKKPIVASNEELASNRRSQSAKLRIIARK